MGFLVTFAMFAQFFFVTLSMQNTLGYSPLQSAVRFLPATLVIIVMGPLAGRLPDRVGPRPLMTMGLLIVASESLIQSRLTIHSGYGLLLPGFILMGVGMGLYLCAATLNQAALAAGRATQACICWTVAAVAYVVFLVLPGFDDRVLQLELGFLFGALVLCAELYWLYRRSLAQA